ncbi:NAD-dependent epimerase/dehydratase family protein [Scrofimicrobium sp. R131]|uniref:NAD-dependent epimerase/dehydratase family protein n=1 Tax=Scrofimicrobium appendicitidis TaxID=3079930 RepID=A0AAU7V7V5_9ACTO
MTKTLVIGGNGLLGHHTVVELLNRGYEVSSLALPPQPGQAGVPEGVEAHWGNLNQMTDRELLDLFAGQDTLFYAIGADERTVPPAPADVFFYRQNVLPTQRVAHLAREAEVKKFVVFGSYTAEFGELWPDLGYRTRNGYPRTRLLQEEVAYLEGAGRMDVMVLRLPYIFGLVEGQRPLWQFILDQVATQDHPVVLPGATSAVTARQVGQAAVGAMEHGTHGGRYPINSYRLTYLELYQLACEALGKDPAAVQVVPLEAVLPSYEQLDAQMAAAGVEHGVHLPDTARFQAREAVSDPGQSAVLQIEPDDVVGAIRETFAWCVANPPEG